MAIIRDVTERKLDQAKLERLNESLRDFIAFAAHDMRSPLTAVRGFAFLLRDHDDDLPPEKRRELLERILVQSDRLDAMVVDLLTTSQIEARTVPMAPASIPIMSSPESLAFEIAPASSIIVDCDPTLSAVVDPGHLQRMVGNYLINALKYGALPIEIITHLEDDAIVISVCDHGAGVSEEFAPFIFDKFTRSPDARTTEGTGLGLPIVRGLARANGGEAWYEPGSSGGSRFCLRLPGVTR